MVGQLLHDGFYFFVIYFYLFYGLRYHFFYFNGGPFRIVMFLDGDDFFFRFYVREFQILLIYLCKGDVYFHDRYVNYIN